MLAKSIQVKRFAAVLIILAFAIVLSAIVTSVAGMSLAKEYAESIQTFGLEPTHTLDLSAAGHTEAGVWTFMSGIGINTFSIEDGANIRVTGASINNFRTLRIQTGTANIVLDNVVMNNGAIIPIWVGSGATLNLTLIGENALSTNHASAHGVIRGLDNAKLIIDGTGSLNVNAEQGNGNAIRFDTGSSIEINSGTITATVGTLGVAIGACTIAVNGGEIAATARGSGAAIGSERDRDSIVNITGGIVTAESVSGAGIGGGLNGRGNVTISGGIVTASANGGAGIGDGQTISGQSRVSGNITITGGVITAISHWGAGIGGGSGGTGHTGPVGTVTITGGIVNARSNTSSSCDIGTSGDHIAANYWNKVVISGGSVFAANGKIRNLATLFHRVRVTVEDSAGILINRAAVSVNAFEAITGDNFSDAAFDALDEGAAWLWLPAGETEVTAYYDGKQVSRRLLVVPNILNNLPIRLATHTVSFDPNFDTGMPAAPADITNVVHFESIERPVDADPAEFNLSGFTNSGNWYVRENGEYVLFEFGVTPINDDTTLVLRWTDNNVIAARAVYDKIALLPAMNVITLAHADAVEAARRAFDGLTQIQRDIVTNFGILTDAEFRVFELQTAADNQAAARVVIDKIAALSSIGEIGLLNAQEVSAARAAYNGLTLVQRELVFNRSVLTAAETKISQLQTEANNQAAAQTVIDQIAALPAIGNLTTADAGAVATAREAYNRLTLVQRDLVTNRSILISAEVRIAEMQTSGNDNGCGNYNIVASLILLSVIFVGIAIFKKRG